MDPIPENSKINEKIEELYGTMNTEQQVALIDTLTLMVETHRDEVIEAIDLLSKQNNEELLVELEQSKQNNEEILSELKRQLEGAKRAWAERKAFEKTSETEETSLKL